MSNSVAIKISAKLADEVRDAAEAADRSLTGQIEHWAKIGRAAEVLMSAPAASALKRCAGDISAVEDENTRSRVLDALESFRTRSSEMLRKQIGLNKRSIFEPDPGNPAAMIRVNPDGTRIRGIVKGRKFVPAKR